jgi:predicted DNA-binding ribbon-helix-helix protein
MATGNRRGSSTTPTGRRRPATRRLAVERVQTGVRMEKRLLKVLKALAEYHDLSLGDLLEGIVLHAFEGRSPFSKQSLARIQQLRKVYEVDYDASFSHRLVERDSELS